MKKFIIKSSFLIFCFFIGFELQASENEQIKKEIDGALRELVPVRNESLISAYLAITDSINGQYSKLNSEQKKKELGKVNDAYGVICKYGLENKNQSQIAEILKSTDYSELKRARQDSELKRARQEQEELQRREKKIAEDDVRLSPVEFEEPVFIDESSTNPNPTSLDIAKFWNVQANYLNHLPEIPKPAVTAAAAIVQPVAQTAGQLSEEQKLAQTLAQKLMQAKTEDDRKNILRTDLKDKSNDFVGIVANALMDQGGFDLIELVMNRNSLTQSQQTAATSMASAASAAAAAAATDRPLKEMTSEVLVEKLIETQEIERLFELYLKGATEKFFGDVVEKLLDKEQFGMYEKLVNLKAESKQLAEAQAHTLQPNQIASAAAASAVAAPARSLDTNAAAQQLSMQATAEQLFELLKERKDLEKITLLINDLKSRKKEEPLLFADVIDRLLKSGMGDLAAIALEEAPIKIIKRSELSPQITNCLKKLGFTSDFINIDYDKAVEASKNIMKEKPKTQSQQDIADLQQKKKDAIAAMTQLDILHANGQFA